MNIVIIGMRGTGKTTIGKMLSESLQRQYVETDALVVKRASQSIAQIIEDHGWDHFRDLESDSIKEVTRLDNCVISTGGGAVLRDHNVQLLKKNSIVILLVACVDTMTIRLSKDPKRPSLTGKQSLQDEIIQVLQERKMLYDAAADIVVHTDNQDPLDIIKKILKTIPI